AVASQGDQSLAIRHENGAEEIGGRPMVGIGSGLETPRQRFDLRGPGLRLGRREQAVSQASPGDPLQVLAKGESVQCNTGKGHGNHPVFSASRRTDSQSVPCGRIENRSYFSSGMGTTAMRSGTFGTPPSGGTT